MERVRSIRIKSVNYLQSRFSREVAAYASLILIAFIMRLWQLGARAVSYDENIHMGCGQDIFHNLFTLPLCGLPFAHGTFQFIGTGIIYSIFGESDFTARLLPAIFGTAIVILPFFLRRQLGRWGALSVAILLAFSPLFMYYSRYARGDIYNAFFTLLLVVCIWNYITDKRQRWLYIGAAALSLSFCNLETAYINLAIIALFLLLISGKELLLRVPRRLDLKALSPQAEYLILLGTLALPLYATFINLFRGENIIYELSSKTWAIALVVVFFLISAVVGLRWNPKRWIIATAIFYGIFILIWSVFFTDMHGVSVGLWGDAAYWIDQHYKARGGQPWFYYLMLIPIYEFLPLLFALAGAIYYAIKGSLFSRFLIYWTVASFIIFSFFGEKMPWISLQIVGPVILLGGMFIGFLLKGEGWSRRVQIIVRSSLAVIMLVLFSYTAYTACRESYQVEDDPPQMLLYAGLSADMHRIAGKIDELAQKTGEGHSLSITIDHEIVNTLEPAFDSGWYWYLRDYTNVDTPDLSSITSVPSGSVLILATSHVPADSQYLEKYGEGEKIKTTIWFPEEYKGDFSFGWWWNYFLHRETKGPYWNSEVVVYFPKAE